MNLRENYFVKLIKYIKNVYHIDKQIKYITDSRLNPTYKASHIISLVLARFLLRIRSFNQLNLMIVLRRKKWTPKMYNHMHRRSSK